MSVSAPHRQTAFAWRPLALGSLVALAGLVLLGVAAARAGALAQLGGTGPLALLAFGPLVQLVQGAAQLTAGVDPAAASPGWPLGAGAALWLAGCGLLATGIRRVPSPALSEPPSAAAGAPLYPRLARYRDFYWSTLSAYGGGVLLAELTLILLQQFLSSGSRGLDAGTRGWGLPPTGAFAVALVAAFGVAFTAGFIGASRAQRLSLPEATVGVLYLGVPVPLLLTLMESVRPLQLALGPRLREVTYLASLIGRPELGYWLVFVFLVLALVLGINTGFVAAGSGRMDLRTGFELFVARRHVNLMRPSLVLGTLAVLLLGIIPPLLVYFVIRAAEAAVERTRVRKLGEADPLAATAALHRLKQNEQTPTAMMTALSVGGVGVGVMALIVVLSVMSGFEADLQQKILGAHAHARVESYEGDLPDQDALMQRVKKVPGVVGLTPFIHKEVMIASESETEGVIIKGIDPATVSTVTDLEQALKDGIGSLEDLAHPDAAGLEGRQLIETDKEGNSRPSPLERLSPEDRAIIGDFQQGDGTAVAGSPGILLGRELAASLRVTLGDQVSVMSAKGIELGPSGPIPKFRTFRVAGIFYTGMYEYDSKFVYILLEEAQRFFDVKGAQGLEIKFADVDDARRLSRKVTEALGGYPFRTRDWGEMNANLFSALRLEKLVMGIILSIIIIVAAGLIVATVVMLVLEKRKEIAVLKALGVSDGGILKIFLAEGLQIGVAGGLIGLVSGLAWCFFIQEVGIKMDPEVYYIPQLPVRIEPVQTILAVVIAVLITYLASIYPALKASSVEPVEGLKAE